MTNKEHILKKHGAFYAATKRTLDTKRERGIDYEKMENHIWCPANNVYMLECDLRVMGRKA